MSDVIAFDVCGRLFKTLKFTIQKYPSTLLSQLLDDYDTDCAKPIFIDRDPQRFALILDWYRHGVIHVPPSCSVQAVRRDAEYFLLPPTVRIEADSEFALFMNKKINGPVTIEHSTVTMTVN
eukprot:2645453-Amphidinium_carterae.1